MTRLRRLAQIAVPAALAAAGAASTGCGGGGLNRGPAIVDDFAVEAIAPERVPWTIPPMIEGFPDRPSLASGSLDRSGWTLRRVVVPAAVSEGYPTYATGPTYARGTARQRGEYPTIESALDLTAGESAWSEIFEGLAWPFWAGLDVALMPARMIAQPPWETIHYPDARMERAPGGTASPRMLGDNTAIPVPGLGLRPTVPALAEPRWIWLNGRWYHWKPGAAEPWIEPPAGSYPPPPITEPRWVWRDGKWYLWKPGEPEPWLAPPAPLFPPSPGAPTPPAAPRPVEPGQPADAPATGPGPGAVVPAAPAATPKPRWVFRNGKWVREDPPGAPASEPKP